MWEKISIGLQLTVYGTGLVFLILAFLWGLMSVLLRLDHGEAVEAPKEEQSVPAATEPGRLSPQERAAITLAVLAYKGLVGKMPRVQAQGQERISASNSWVALGRARQLGRPRRV